MGRPRRSDASDADDLDPVFRALADPVRRRILDHLRESDGASISDLHLSAGQGMGRFGVAKHLRVLEASGLVTSVKVGRERKHFINLVPIRMIHDRWIASWAEPLAAAMSELKRQLDSPRRRRSTRARFSR